MDTSLKNIILTEYPLPIGVFYSRLLTEERRAIQNEVLFQSLFFFLIDTFEITCKFLTIVILADYIKEGAFSEEHNKLIWNKLNKKLSLGDWIQLLRETIRIFEQHNKELFIPELTAFYFSRKSDKLKPSPISRTIDEFVTLRNKKKGHSITLSTAEYKDLYKQYKPKMEEILSALTYLADYSMISPIDIQDNQIIFYHTLRGTAITQSYNEIMLERKIEEGNIILIRNNNPNQSLMLSPLSYFEIAYENLEQYYCLYEEAQSSNDLIKKLVYLGITTTTKNKSFSISEGDEDKKELLRRFSTIFQRFYQIVEIVLKADSVALANQSKKEYYLSSQIDLINNYEKTFIGRTYTFESINELTQKKSSGYILLTGSPGQGKTSVAAHFTNLHQCVHHFISNTEGRNNEKIIIQSLFHQACKKIGIDIAISEVLDDLRRDFSNLLHKYSSFCLQQESQGWIVIDALDELTDYQENLTLSFLPQNLPPKIFVLLTSRPVKAVSNFHFELLGQIDLKELTFEETKHLIRQQYPNIQHSTIIQLFNCSQGNPLFINIFLKNQSKLNEIVSSEFVPGTLETLIFGFLQELRNSQNENLLKVIGLLVVSRGGLTIFELSEILEKPKYYIINYIKELLPYLVMEGKRYKLFHKKLAEFLLNETNEVSFEKSEIYELHSMIIKFCEPYQEKEGSYARKNLVHHYFSIHNIQRILELAQLPELGPSIVELIVENLISFEYLNPVAQNKFKTLMDALLQEVSGNQTTNIVIDALEWSIYRGLYSLALPYLLLLENRLSKANGSIGETIALYKVSYQLATIKKETGHVREALDRFAELNSKQPDGLSEYYERKVSLEFANAARTIGDHDKAIELYKKAISFCSTEMETDQYLEIQHYLCDLIFVRGDYPRALREANNAIDLATAHGLNLRKAQMLRIIGQIHYELEDYVQAIDYYKESLSYFSELGLNVYLGKIYNNLALASAHINLKEANEYVNLAKEINNKLGKRLENGKSALARSIVSRRTNDFSQAEVYALKSLELFNDIGYQSGIAFALFNFGLLFYKIQDTKGALTYAQKAVDVLYERETLGDQIYILKSTLLKTIVSNQLPNPVNWDELNLPLNGIKFLDDTASTLNRLTNNILKDL